MIEASTGRRNGQRTAIHTLTKAGGCHFTQIPTYRVFGHAEFNRKICCKHSTFGLQLPQDDALSLLQEEFIRVHADFSPV